MKQITLSTLAALTLAFSANGMADVDTYKIDNTHSFANWELRHVVAHSSGTFHDISGKVLLDTANLAKSSVEVSISVYSLNSSHLRRDVHVLTDEFLDARNFPEMKFVSTGVSPVSSERGLMTGQLTLHGVTKPVTLEYQILGIGNDPWGGVRAGFKASTRISRSDFGITKYAVNGPVGNEVDITLLIEGIKLGADGQPYNVKKAAAEEKPKVISYPMPVAQPAPVAQPVPPQPAPAAVPAAAAQPAVAAPAQTASEQKDSLEDQLKKRLKGFLK
jgi:polyisoprenoid-binding protein YceI